MPIRDPPTEIFAFTDKPFAGQFGALPLNPLDFANDVAGEQAFASTTYPPLVSPF